MYVYIVVLIMNFISNFIALLTFLNLEYILCVYICVLNVCLYVGWDTWMCGESWLSSQGWAFRCPVIVCLFVCLFVSLFV